jgi:predicted unusual protein kinase regulating ubiquinone biosynthesis (AarF/ABC1/UbiB family)
MKDQNSIPTSKVARATTFMKAGVQVGGNYIKHYAKKMMDPSLTKEDLHRDNAEDIYKSLSNLKGSALKVAQMMSMERGLLPKAYTEKFTMSQYSAPPLSAPLVIKTFKTFFGKSPSELFDKFDMTAANAASIGQVHIAYKDGKKYAVKVQYPGIADSVSSDLKIARPLAVQLLNLNDLEIDRYFKEVEEKLLEETDYDLEIASSIEITEAVSHIPNLFFPKYYKELSSKRILTMDWIDGMHMNEFLATNPSQAVRNQVGQTLWDFYDFQFHTLRKVHADPHPGNFIMTDGGQLGIMDFGCIKVVPEDYYDSYFALMNPDTLKDDGKIDQIFTDLQFLMDSDTKEEKKIFRELFITMTSLLGRPFEYKTFAFGDENYFKEVYDFAEKLTNIEQLKTSKAVRGSQHGLYVNRTYFGIYSILNQLKATIKVNRPAWLTPAVLKEVG